MCWGKKIRKISKFLCCVGWISARKRVSLLCQPKANIVRYQIDVTLNSGNFFLSHSFQAIYEVYKFCVGLRFIRFYVYLLISLRTHQPWIVWVCDDSETDTKENWTIKIDDRRGEWWSHLTNEPRLWWTAFFLFRRKRELESHSRSLGQKSQCPWRSLNWHWYSSNNSLRDRGEASVGASENQTTANIADDRADLGHGNCAGRMLDFVWMMKIFSFFYSMKSRMCSRSN